MSIINSLTNLCSHHFNHQVEKTIQSECQALFLCGKIVLRKKSSSTVNIKEAKRGKVSYINMHCEE